jgi:hypothetical protein
LIGIAHPVPATGQDRNQYVLNVPQGTDVSIEAISHADYIQKVDVLISGERSDDYHVAFYGTGEGVRMKPDIGGEKIILKGVKDDGTFAKARKLTFTFLFNTEEPTSWRDYVKASSVRSYGPEQKRGRPAFNDPQDDYLWTVIIGASDNSGHKDYNDSLVFVALLTHTPF